MRRLFTPLAILTALLFAYSPVMIANAPYESTMGLIQKIFYYHVPSWFAMFTAVFICGIASVMYLFRSRPEFDRVAAAAAEIAVVFGLIGLVTGPLWARKAWGIWWQWDARLTMALLVEMIFIGYLLVRAEVRRPGIRQARRRGRDLRDGERAVRLRIGEHLADRAPEDERRTAARSNRARHGGAVLVLRAGVHAALRAAADGENPSRAAAGGTRPAVSRRRRLGVS